MSEVVLTGVNLSQYAYVDEAGEKTDFAGLLKLLLDNTSSIKFRISSFYPQHITRELCKILADKRVQPFFHLSIQSGSDRILKLMRRPYKRSDVINAVNLLREVKNAPFISCDIIAGFPGESEEDFEETKSLCDEVKFAWIHAFPFSPRPGTPAFNMKPQIPERIKDERVKYLTSKAIEGKSDYITRCIGKDYDAIVENSRSQRMGLDEDSIIHCVTDNFLHVECKVNDIRSSQLVLPGSLVRVKIENADMESILKGKETEAIGKIL